MTQAPRLSRIQQKNRETILDAALEVFSQPGFRGATLDQIAEVAGLSKPNLLYYFPSKEAVLLTLLDRVVHTADAALEGLTEKLAEDGENRWRTGINVLSASSNDSG